MAKEQPTLISLVGTALVLAVLAGGFAGIIAAVFTNQSLDRYIQSLRDNMRLVSISEVKPEPLPGTFEEALVRVRSEAWPPIVLIAQKTTASENPASWFTTEEAVGSGVVITSDGWILTTKEELEYFSDPLVGVEIWIDGDRFSLEQVIEDTLTDFVLIKIQASDLQAIAFGPSEALIGGELVFVIPGQEQIQQANLQSIEHNIGQIVSPAEEFNQAWLLTGTDQFGPVVNSNGELVAFVNSDQVAWPFHQAEPFVGSVLRAGEVTHAGLGLRAVDLSYILNIAPEVRKDISTGAMIQSKYGSAAILPGSPAAEAGLLPGDIILAIDDIELSETVSLAELLARYEPDDSVNLKIFRAGEEEILTVTLGVYEDLLY